MQKERSNSEKIQEDVSRIVYSTIQKWLKKPRFKACRLESYDNWKDDLVDKLVRYVNKEPVRIKKGLDIWRKQ